MRDRSIPEEIKGLVKNLGAQKHVKTESVLPGEELGRLGTIIFKYMKGCCLKGGCVKLIGLFLNDH